MTLQQLSKKLITISIPTFNGASTIGRCLDSCLKEITASFDHDVEVLIVDNHSTDQTQDIVLKYVEKYPRLFRYIRNDTNVGLDKNIDLAITNSEGEYVKLLGDDDQLTSDFVSNLKQVISLQKPDLILTSFNVEGQSYLPKNESIKAIKVYNENIEILKDSLGIIGQIASITYKKESYLQIDAEVANCTNHKFMFIAMKLIIIGISSYDSRVSILVSPGSPRFTEKVIDSLKQQQNAIKIYQYILDELDPMNLNKSYVRNLLKSQQLYSLTFIDYIHRYSNMNSFEIIHAFFPMGKKHPVFYFKFVPIALIPRNVTNFVLKLFRP